MFFQIKSFNILLDSDLMNAFLAKHKAEICNPRSNDFIVDSCTSSWLLMKFGKIDYEQRQAGKD